jgi:hypothetical protein
LRSIAIVLAPEPDREFNFPVSSNTQALQCLRIPNEHAAFNLSRDGRPMA